MNVQLECLRCGFAYPPGVAARPVCPDCGAALHLISDTEPRYQSREDYEHARKFTAEQCKCGLHEGQVVIVTAPVTEVRGGIYRGDGK